MTSELGKPLTPAQIKAIYDAHVKPLPKVYPVPSDVPHFVDMLKSVFDEYPLDYDDYHAELIRRCQNMVEHVLANRGNRLGIEHVFEFAAGPPNIFKTTVVGIAMPIYAIGRNRNIRGITLSEDKDLASPSVDKMRNIMLHNEAYTRMFGTMKFEKEKKLDQHKWTQHSFTVTGRTEQHEEPTWSSVGYRSFPAKHHYDFFVGDDPHSEVSQRMKDKVWDMTKQIPARMERWGGFFGVANFWSGMDWSYRMLNEWKDRWTHDPYLRPLSDGTLVKVGEAPDGTAIEVVKSLLPAYWSDNDATRLRDQLFSEGSQHIWAYQFMLDREKAGDRIFLPGRWDTSLAEIGNGANQVPLSDITHKIVVIDPASGSENERSSEVAFHVGAWRPRGTYFWIDSRSGRWKRQMVMEALGEIVLEYEPDVIFVEKVLNSEYLQECMAVKLGELRISGRKVPRIEEVHHRGIRKEKRIEGWLEYWNRGYIQINANMAELQKVRGQLLSFPQCAGNVMDILDAWAYALTGSRQEGIIPMMTDIRQSFDGDIEHDAAQLASFVEAIRRGMDPTTMRSRRDASVEDYICR